LPVILWDNKGFVNQSGSIILSYGRRPVTPPGRSVILEQNQITEVEGVD
jgi:hypothetical protein